MNKIFKALSVAFLSGLAIDMPESKATGLLTQESLAEGDAPKQRLLVTRSMGDAANWLSFVLPDNVLDGIMIHLKLKERGSLATILPESARIALNKGFQARWGICHLHADLPERLAKEMAEKMLEAYMDAFEKHKRALYEGKKSTFPYQGYAGKILSEEALERLRGPKREEILLEMERLKDDPRMLLTFASLLAEDFANHAGLPHYMKRLGLERFNALLKRLEKDNMHSLLRRHVNYFASSMISFPQFDSFLTTCNTVLKYLPDERFFSDPCFASAMRGTLESLSTKQKVEERVRIACDSFDHLLSEDSSKVDIERKTEIAMQLALFPNLDEIEKAADLARQFLLLPPKNQHDVLGSLFRFDVVDSLLVFIAKGSLQQMEETINKKRANT